MSIEIIKRITLLSILVVTLFTFSSLFTVFPSGSCLGGNSSLDDYTCIAGQEASLENTIEVNNSTYGNFRIEERGNITVEGSWESVNSSYTESFSNRYYEAGTYKYMMFVSETKSFSNPDQNFVYTFDVVEANNPADPLTSFQDWVTGTINQIIEEIFELFQGREIGTPTVN